MAFSYWHLANCLNLNLGLNLNLLFILPLSWLLSEFSYITIRLFLTIIYPKSYSLLFLQALPCTVIHYEFIVMKVLFADDSDLILERLQQMAAMFNNTEVVGTYRNGTDALEAIRTLKPDLAVVDYKMPGMNGLQVLTQIRKEEWTGRFILLTFFPSGFYRQQARLAGADYFFSKVDDFEKVSGVMAFLGAKKKDKKELKTSSRG